MATMQLSTAVLQWAAEQVGESWQALADSLGGRVGDLEAVRQGKLTPAQVEKVAKKTRVPFGSLLLDRPPREFHPKIPDLRQSPDAPPLSPDFWEALEDAVRKQGWYHDFSRANGGDELTFVGMFATGPKPDAMRLAREVSQELKISPEDRRQAADEEGYFRVLSAKAEAAGILVLKSGIVRGSTRRALSPREFRGFALPDRYAPLVFINGNDWEVAAVFTLIHEICHLWIGQSGVSDLALPDQSGVEALCNAATAEILVPEAEFVLAFDSSPDLSGLARRFRVSRLVVARRAFALRKITKAEYQTVANASANAKPQRKESSGGDPYKTIPVRNSKRLTMALLDSAGNGRTLYREAARLLNVRPETVVELAKRQGAS